MLYEERARKGKGDFPLSARIQGFWDSADAELDLVALCEPERRIRFGTCKRDAERIPPALAQFDAHIARFLNTYPRYREWTIERTAIATRHTAETRRFLGRSGVLAEDLETLTRGLG